MDRPLITIGFHKGEMDFGINGSIVELDFKQINELRVMVVVAIGVAEDMIRRQVDINNPTSKESKP